MKRILIITLVLAIVLPSFAQKKLTLQEAISIALQGNSALTKMKNNLETSKSSVLNAYGKLIPNLGGQAGWSWQRVNDVGGKQRDYFGQEVDIPPSQTDSRNYNIALSSDITLFNGLANYASINQAKENLKSAEYSISKQKQTIVFQTTDLYYNVLNADELLKVRDENLQYYKKFLETVQERNKLGSVAIADVYAAQVQEGNAELQLIQAQNALETAKNTLLNYLALNVMDEYTFDDPFANDKNIDTDKYMKDFSDIQAMVNAAMDSRFDYKSQLSSLNAAEEGITIAKGGVYPSLSGSLQYYTYAVDPSKLFDRKVLSFGLNLSIPIFSNFNVSTQIQAAQASFLNAQEDLSILGRQIKIEVKQGFNDFVAAKKSLDVAVNNVTAASETRKINQERYNLGSATILDVLQASRDYTDAQRNKINAAYDFYRQHDNLTNALGRLDFQKYE
jgi:outer membrane protein